MTADQLERINKAADKAAAALDRLAGDLEKFVWQTIAEVLRKRK